MSVPLTQLPEETPPPPSYEMTFCGIYPSNEQTYDDVMPFVTNSNPTGIFFIIPLTEDDKMCCIINVECPKNANVENVFRNIIIHDTPSIHDVDYYPFAFFEHDGYISWHEQLNDPNLTLKISRGYYKRSYLVAFEVKRANDSCIVM